MGFNDRVGKQMVFPCAFSALPVGKEGNFGYCFGAPPEAVQALAMGFRRFGPFPAWKLL